MAKGRPLSRRVFSLLFVLAELVSNEQGWARSALEHPKEALETIDGKTLGRRIASPKLRQAL